MLKPLPQPEPTPIAKNSPFARIQCLSGLGQLLNTVRRAQQLEVEQIATELHLKPSFIEALESGDWSNLPGEAYGRGYLRQYAEYLGLSADEATSCCQTIQGKVDSKLDYLDIVSTQDTPAKGTLWLSAFAFFAIIIGWLVYQPKLELTAGAISPPPQLSADESMITAAPLAHTVEASCLNIPSAAIRPCFAQGGGLPSLLLTSYPTYPIWNR